MRDAILSPRHGRAWPVEDGRKRPDVPAIPLRLAMCSPDRDGRDKPGHDVVRFVRSLSDAIVRQPMTYRHASSPVLFGRRRVRPYSSCPSTTSRGTERREAQRLGFRCRLAAAPERISRRRETRAPCGAPPSQACAGWALSWAAISLPGTVLPGRGQMEFPILAGSDPTGSCGLWPAFVRPTSSPLLWAAPLSWGGRQTRASRTHGCEPCRGRRIAHGPVLLPAPRCQCLAAPPTAPLQERLMKRPSMSRTEIGL